MKISRSDSSLLNAVITIDVERKDFEEKVSNVLTDYRKKAIIPGFRKGHVPMGLIKKQYETSVTVDEVNKLLQENLDKYLKEENINILGNPLPIIKDELDWKASKLSFAFELGLAPEIEVNLTEKNKIIHYHITAGETMINDQIKQHRKQYGKLIPRQNPLDEFEITAVFKNEAAKIEVTNTFDLSQISGKSNLAALKKAMVGTVLHLNFKKLFKDDATATRILKISVDKIPEIDKEITIEIKEINERVLAEMNQEFFDKIYGPDKVKSEDEMRNRIVESMEKQFEQQSDQKLLKDVTEYLIKKIKFDLPSEFLIKWIKSSGKEPMTVQEAKEEYDRSEKGIRYQLIEEKIIADNNLNINFDELKNFAKDIIVSQIKQYGQAGLPDEELDGIVARVMSNKDETRRLSEQLMSKKLLGFFKSNFSLKKKKIDFDKFIKEVYGQG